MSVVSSIRMLYGTKYVIVLLESVYITRVHSEARNPAAYLSAIFAVFSSTRYTAAHQQSGNFYFDVYNVRIYDVHGIHRLNTLHDEEIFLIIG